MPFDAIGEGLGRGMLYILSLHVLWFAGIHGANILDPITHDIYGAAMLANEVAAAAGEPLPHIMTKTFMDTFVFIGRGRDRHQPCRSADPVRQDAGQP